MLKHQIKWLAACSLLIWNQNSDVLYADKKVRTPKNYTSNSLEDDSFVKDKLVQVNNHLDKGYRIEQAIAILKLKLPFKNSDQKKITAKLFKLVNTPVIHKKDRLLILNHLFSLAKKSKQDQKYFITAFIDLAEKIKSPNLSDVLLERTFNLLPRAGENERQISDLQSRIIEDIYTPLSKQEFTQRQHSITLRSLKAYDNDQNKRVLLKLFEAVNNQDIPHAIRLEIFNFFNKQTIEKADQNNFFSNLELKSIFVQLAKSLKSSQKTLLQPEELRPEEIEEFKVQIAIAENLLGNPKLNRNRQELLNPLLAALNSMQPQVVELAGAGLINTKIIEVEHRIKGIDLTNPIIQHAQKRIMNTTVLQGMMDQAQQQSTASAEVTQDLSDMSRALASSKKLQNIALELLSEYGAVLIRASLKEPQVDLVTVYTFLKDKFLSSHSWEAKIICLSAFQNLDIDLIQSRYFPNSALEILDQMFRECFDVLALESEDADLNRLKIKISEVLSNITGADLGLYSQDWKTWRRGVLGKRFFAKR